MIFALSMMSSTPASGQAAPTPLQPNAIPGVPPRLIQFASSLDDASGNRLTDRAAVTFSIYADQTGGVPLWQETQNIQFSQGHYSVFLGDSTPGGIPTELFASGQSRWLGVRAVLPGEQEQPRILLASVPYALKAGDADTLGGLPASAFLRTIDGSTNNFVPLPQNSTVSGTRTAPPPASAVTTSGGTPGTIPMFSTATDIENSPVTVSGGNVNIPPTLTVCCSLTAASAGVIAESVNGAVNPTVCGLSNAPSWCNNKTDFGDWVNNAIGSLPGKCGEVYIPAGIYPQKPFTFITTILKPRCVLLRGASVYGTTLNFAPSTGCAVVVADPAGPSNYPSGAVEDLSLAGTSNGNSTCGIFFGGSDGTPTSPPIGIDPASNYGDHGNVNRVRIAQFGKGVQFGLNTWSDTIFESVIEENGTGVAMSATAAASTKSGENITIESTSIQNSAGEGLFIGTGLQVNFNLVDTSIDNNGCKLGPPPSCNWQIQNGTAYSQVSITMHGGYITSSDHWILNYGRFLASGNYVTNGSNSGTLGYLIDNENGDNFTVVGGQWFNSGSGCITNTSGQGTSWYGVLTTSPSCPNGGITSSNVVYRCGGSGALTVNPSSCSSPTDTGLRVK
jgi:hypothetical protein